MKKKLVTIIRYNVANISNVIRAFEYLGASVNVVSNGDDIINSDYMVLPGVGAFEEGMKSLKNKNLIVPIKKWISSDRPFLGICLGMQMLFESSDEFGTSKGLSIISGKVKKLPRNLSLKVPNISWESLHLVNDSNNQSWENSILQNVNLSNDFYFVHSYACYPEDKKKWFSKTLYGNHAFCSVVKDKNLYGCQFHPEKSGENGLEILEQFLKI
tara:strand:- start:476 stop:1117 length:642 start_codon:yes stop_codon:yes gene_type:complete